jgi:CRP-like cAMP-binding protein
MPMKLFKNTLLRAFEPDLISRLDLRPVVLKVGHELEHPGSPVTRLYFLEEGMASMTTTFQDGSQVEVGTFGYESVIGVSALMGTKQSLNRVYTQIAGWGHGVNFAEAKVEFARCGTFQRLTLRYVQAQLVQAMQSAGCNATHTVEQRLARWLLICADRANESEFKMSQEFLSHMLGTARPTVSTVAAVLKHEKLIDYVRGTIRILDRVGLERRSCECYRVVTNHLANYAAFDTANMA